MYAPAHQEHFCADTQPSLTPPKVVVSTVRVPARKIRRRLELVNVSVAKDDYEKLKAFGGCNRDHIEMALSSYLHLMKNTTLPRGAMGLGWRRGPVISFLCTLPKELLVELRNLPGRLDDHVIQAVRLLFQDDGSGSHVRQVPKSHLSAALTRGFLFATYAGAAFFVSRILRVVENLSPFNR